MKITLNDNKKMMNLKKVLWILWVVSLFWFWVVYSSYNKEVEAQVVWILSKKIYLDSSNLNSSVLALKSLSDISKFSFKWACNSTTNFLYSKENIYFYSLFVTDKNCSNWNFYFYDEKWLQINKVSLSFEMLSNFSIYNKFVDYKTDYLSWQLDEYKKVLDKLNDYKTYQVLNSNLDVVKKSRLYAEAIYNYNVISNILQKREYKYKIPVEWFSLPTRSTKLPNSGRPYRASYTDWVHEWWDIDAEYLTPVQAIWDAMIIKIVNWYKFEDTNTVKTWENLSDEQKNINLDILRWNQVWLKTMKWDVMFYAHLSKIDENLKVWDFVYKWQYLWNVWKSWVPDLNYKDYHLHFELRKNPHNNSKAWNYTLLDYMTWDWYFKSQTQSYIKEHQYDVFEK